MFVSLEDFFNNYRIKNGQIPNEVTLNRGLFRLKREIRELKSMADVAIGNEIETWNSNKFYEKDEYVEFGGKIFKSNIDGNFNLEPGVSPMWERKDVVTFKEMVKKIRMLNYHVEFVDRRTIKTSEMGGKDNSIITFTYLNGKTVSHDLHQVKPNIAYRAEMNANSFALTNSIIDKASIDVSKDTIKFHDIDGTEYSLKIRSKGGYELTDTIVDNVKIADSKDTLTFHKIDGTSYNLKIKSKGGYELTDTILDSVNIANSKDTLTFHKIDGSTYNLKIKSKGGYELTDTIIDNVSVADSKDTLTFRKIDGTSYSLKIKSKGGYELTDTILNNVNVENAKITFNKIDGKNYSFTINNVNHSATADKWTTPRTMTVSDGTHTTTVLIDGSQDFTAKLPSTINAELNGNAKTATTLKTARTINGTSFDGSSNITTNSWGTSRNISITDGSSTSTAVSVNGSKDIILNLPSTINANNVVSFSGSGTDTITPVLGSNGNGTSFTINNVNNAKNVTGLNLNGHTLTIE